ncbi:DUF434 domain-containing protein [Methanosalsum zhilinae]|nr:DUF434 domain-containing protein [Methanosalsum zhilinae]
MRNENEKNILISAADDIRYLLKRGYPKPGALRFVCNHYRLDSEYRNILNRVTVSPDIAQDRMKKRTECCQLTGKKIAVDGYNLLITVDSMLTGHTLWKCDDGFIRDARGAFRGYSITPATYKAVKCVLSLLSKNSPAYVKILLDTQMSRSGELAGYMREQFNHTILNFEVKTSRRVDHDLKKCSEDMIIATSDGVIIDAAAKVVDLAGCISKDIQINPEKIPSKIQICSSKNNDQYE